MAWEIIDPRATRLPLNKNECRIRGDGYVVFNAETLRDAGIGDRAVVMLDSAGGRIGFRCPMPDENAERLGAVVRSAADKKNSAATTDRMIRAHLAFAKARWELVKKSQHKGVRKCYVRAAGRDGSPALLIADVLNRGIED